MIARLALALILATAPAAAGPATRVLDLAGRPANPLMFDSRTRATVLVFTTTDCPISNRYAPEIERLAARFAAQGIRFVLVYPVRADEPATIREHLTMFAYSMDAVRDTAQELVTLTGVSVTPEVAVMDATARVLYRGRIDDRYLDFGRDRPHPTERDLERALEAVVEGRPIAVRETRAVGCILADLVQ